MPANRIRTKPRNRPERDRFRKPLAAAGLAWLVLAAAACGGATEDGGTEPPPSETTVTISPKTATLARGGTQPFTAVVSGEDDQSIRWRVNGVTGGDATHGLISMGGVYIAPTTVPSPATVTVTAVSLVDPTKSDSASVTVQAGSDVSVVIGGAGEPLAVPTFGSHALSATVTGASNTALTWLVDGVEGGSAVTGTVSPDGLYYAPHSAPVSTAANNLDQVTDVIVTAVSQEDATASDSIIIVPTPPHQSGFPAPVPLGTSGGNAKDKSTSGSTTFCCSGTLGSLLSRGGRLYILSNNHVLARSDLGTVGDPIIQPGLVSNNCSSVGATVVANLSQFFDLETGPTPRVDAAIAEIVANAVDPLGTILQLGGTTNGDQPTDGTPNPGPGVSPSIGRLVAKSGTATGLTCGSILALNVSVNVEYQKGCNTGSTYDVDFLHQIDIGGIGFSALGDSGALIVTQDTADPVGLLYAGSESDTIAHPVASVLSQMADPDTQETPLFAGDTSVGPHPVAACSIPQPEFAPAPRAGALRARTLALGAGETRAATSARDPHAAELLSMPGVRALGVGASLDNPRQPAVILFVERGRAAAGYPAEVDGVRTRIVEGAAPAAAGLLTEEQSRALLNSAASPRLVYPVPEAEIRRALAVQAAREAGLLGRRGIQGVGVTSSLDAPGEAALMVFVIRGTEPVPSIPAVIDGLRTRVRESGRFRGR